MTTIAEVLHRAADRYLEPVFAGEPTSYSCEAIYEADAVLWPRICKGLSEMGLVPHSVTQFEDVPPDERQAARYAWLKFAAMIAEEQGV
jgi:hypothetical protein